MNTIYFYNNKIKEYSSFSNFFHCRFIIDGIQFSCSEQALMYYKAKLFKDQKVAEEILNEKHPPRFKALGRTIQNFNSDEWNKSKFQIMKIILFHKFSQNNRMKERLLSTKENKIADAAKYDKIWGIGLTLEEATAGMQWQGKNLLGKALEETRTTLIQPTLASDILMSLDILRSKL